jgi:hypothetical protein
MGDNNVDGDGGEVEVEAMALMEMASGVLPHSGRVPE